MVTQRGRESFRIEAQGFSRLNSVTNEKNKAVFCHSGRKRYFYGPIS